VTGLHAANTGAGVPLNLLTTTFGPRYTWTPAHRSAPARTVSIFGEGLVGEAHGFDSLFPGPSSANTSALSLAVQVGGGVDISLSQHLSLRVVQASWLRTQFPNTTTNVQNDLLLGAGIVLHTGNH
jgi:peptidoglycan-associated lipoprotein